MREELKQREAELEKSLEDKQQLKNQVQTLKEGLHNLQSTHVMQVSLTENTFLCSGFPENEEQGRIDHVSLVCCCRSVHFGANLFESEHNLRNEFKMSLFLILTVV